VLITFGSPGLVDFFAPRIAGRAIDLVPFGALNAIRKYDAVFVDEAQDLMTAQGMDLLDTVISGGRASGRWRMFLDPNNQAHVDGEFDADVLALVADEATTLDLDLNVRNTQAMVHVVQEYLGADVGDPGIVHGEKVQWHMPSGAANVEAAEAIAADLVSSGVRRSEIWIVRTDSVEQTTTTTNGFAVITPRYAKGLEAEHVVVCCLPAEFDLAGTAAFYVAVTRARVSLHIVASKADKKTLQLLVKKQLAQA
jgi:superfamily I DNA/RNA helicase